MDSWSRGLTPGGAKEPDQGQDAGLGRRRLELPDAANELLSIVRYVAADEGPSRAARDDHQLSSWDEEVLLKALERLEVIDHFLRGRVAFLVAGKDHGYGPCEGELELAGAALDACRAAVRVVDATLEGRPLSEHELSLMNATAEKIRPALGPLESCED